MQRSGAVMALVVAALAGAGYVFWPKAPAAPKAGGGAPLVEVTPLTRGRVVEKSEAIGSLRANESVSLTAKGTGTVEKISFEEGALVKAGDELLRLDVAERRADLEAARAAIATAKAQRAETGIKYERALTLRRSNVVSEASVSDLALQLKTIDTNISAAEARERSAHARLDDLILRAPFAGRVGLRLVSLGAQVDSKTIVTSLDDLSRMRLDFSVPETDLARVKVEALVSATASAFPGRVFTGKVVVIDTRIDPVTRAVKVTALLPNPDGVLRPGMFLSVQLATATREDALLAPEEAVIAEGPRQIAYIVKDGKIDRRAVTIGQRQEGKVEILSGLEAGEVLVVRGVQKIRAGMPVTTRPAFPDAASSAAQPAPPKG